MPLNSVQVLVCKWTQKKLMYEGLSETFASYFFLGEEWAQRTEIWNTNSRIF
jgi:hypothetical protein